jgi:hypothetical protein
MQRVIFQHLILSKAALPCMQKSRECAVLMSAAHLAFSSIPKLFPPRLQSSHPANGLVEPWKWCETELKKKSQDAQAHAGLLRSPIQSLPAVKRTPSSR